jgi:hypothetical protein
MISRLEAYVNSERHFEDIHRQRFYEHDYYFLSQLYEVDWVARTTIKS